MHRGRPGRGAAGASWGRSKDASASVSDGLSTDPGEGGGEVKLASLTVLAHVRQGHKASFTASCLPYGRLLEYDIPTWCNRPFDPGSGHESHPNLERSAATRDTYYQSKNFLPAKGTKPNCSLRDADISVYNPNRTAARIVSHCLRNISIARFTVQ